MTNLEEYLLGTYPFTSDSDDDGLFDGDEINIYGTDPLNPDTDGDTISDGGEISLGLSPVMKDSDENGIEDSEEKILQTFTYEVEDKCDIKEIKLTMKASNYLQETTEIESMMDIDVMSAGVVGLIGEPFEITTTSVFDECKLSFKVDESILQNHELKNIIFLWFDQETMKYEMLDTEYEETTNTVSTTVSHFSRYMIVDKDEWFDAWNELLDYENQQYSNGYTVLAIDCSGSMASNDPVPNVIFGSKEAKRTERYNAAYYFIEAMEYGDKTAVVTFSDKASVACKLTDSMGKDSLYAGIDNFYENGGTNFEDAIKVSLDQLEMNDNDDSNVRKQILLLSDGTPTTILTSETLARAKANNVKIYTIGLGDCDETILENIAQETEGEFFRAYRAKQLVELYAKIGMSEEFDKTDTDKDGLPDAIESAGIRLIDGRIIYTDPSDPDTDNDGLLDGQEIDPDIKCRVYDFSIFGLGVIRRYYFDMKSDPRNDDCDGDGYKDGEELNRYNTSPIESNVRVRSLSQNYISVYYTGEWTWENSNNNLSYGGNQSWFENYFKEKNENDIYWVVSKYGCGIIAIADTLLYMAQADQDYATNITDIAYNLHNNEGRYEYYSYMSYLSTIGKYFPILTNVGGVLGITLAAGVEKYKQEYDLNLCVDWLFSKEKTLQTVKRMIKNDVPVVLSVGPNDLNGIAAYNRQQIYNNRYVYYIARNDNDTLDEIRINDHYVTVTGVIQDKIAKTTMLEISSWGNKYYIDFDEYTRFIENTPFITNKLSFFSNILYIGKE